MSRGGKERGSEAFFAMRIAFVEATLRLCLIPMTFIKSGIDNGRWGAPKGFRWSIWRTGFKSAGTMSQGRVTPGDIQYGLVIEHLVNLQVQSDPAGIPRWLRLPYGIQVPN